MTEPETYDTGVVETVTRVTQPALKNSSPASVRHRLRNLITCRYFKAPFLILFFSCYLAGISLVSVFIYAAKDLPSVETFWTPNRPTSVQILDRNGHDILVRGAQESDPISLTTLPTHVPNAVMAIEDKRFYIHAGLDPIGLTRALITNHKAGRVVQGGSTLTQQLAKNVFLTSDRTLNRKLQEMLLAVWLERTFSKDEILEKYLNRVYFGGNAWGMEAAAQQYFRKSATDITLREGALLAAVLKGPTRYNPIASPERAGTRTALVLATMEAQGRITRDAQANALTSPIHVFPPESADSSNYFVDWIWKEMETAIGPPRTDIVIRTTLDHRAQKHAIEAVAANIDTERGATQAAVVTMDGNGGVQAMVGGVAYGDNQFNRAVQASRQPGSAFKPFVYLAGFNAGLTPWDMRIDAPISIDGWTPRNFTQTFRGEMSLEAAFALSINTIAVQLSEEVGRERVADTGDRFGIKGLKPLRSLPLGAQNTTPLTLTAAYMPFANSGDYVKPHGILSISTANGTPLYDRPTPIRAKVVSSHSLGHINRIMKFAVDNGTGRRARLPGRDVAGKTGTTNDYRDAWFMGYVPDMVTGVWMGADDNTPMKRITGGTLPAQIWHDMMSAYLSELDQEPGSRTATARLPTSQPPLRANADQSLDLLLNDIELALP